MTCFVYFLPNLKLIMLQHIYKLIPILRLRKKLNKQGWKLYKLEFYHNFTTTKHILNSSNLFRSLVLANIFPQCGHLCIFFFSWTHATCCFICVMVLKDFPHHLHVWGLSLFGGGGTLAMGLPLTKFENWSLSSKTWAGFIISEAVFVVPLKLTCSFGCLSGQATFKTCCSWNCTLVRVINRILILLILKVLYSVIKKI